MLGCTRVRFFLDSDSVACSRIGNAAWRQVLATYYDEATINHFQKYHEPARYIQISQQYSSYSKIFVAETNGFVLGFCLLGDLQNPKREGEIYQLFVDPNHRREGAGTLLYATAEQFAREKGITKLRCDSAIHPETIRFWERCGFESKGDMIRKYPDGFEAKVVYMEKQFSWTKSSS
ncbi:MAG: GNAT family N-acetyltransferase [Thaumarchaeota archaeon]|nr:GNAT family N-acetyltransferase [Nitrososphaerota archaeon]